MWILLGILSSVFLGFHEIVKKAALNLNAVIPVLFIGTLSGALIFLPFLVFSNEISNYQSLAFLHIPTSSLTAHLLYILKSLIVACAWIFGYFSVKHLPVTLLAPLNASGPVWIILGAYFIYNEKLNGLQWVGVIISLGFYYYLSFMGKIKGIDRVNRRWIWFAFLSIILNSVSALLDKYLVRHYDRIAMQAWYSIYTALIFGIVLWIFWYKVKEKVTGFQWRWSAVLIGIFLVLADYFYFMALSNLSSMVSILIIIRRASAVLVFAAGALYFKETSLRKRFITLVGILAGVALVIFGSI